MSRIDIKRCAIPGCVNMDIGEKPKHFYTAPRNFSTRGLWMMAVGKMYAPTTKFFVCEDHFDLNKDVDYVHHITGKPVLMQGSIPTLRLEGSLISENVDDKQLNPHSYRPETSEDHGVPEDLVELDKLNTAASIESDTDPNELQYFRSCAAYKVCPCPIMIKLVTHG